MKYVYEVYLQKSFSQAAKTLFVSQSAVSSMVRRAEDRIGCQIFDRSTIPFTLTEEGKFYISNVESCARWRTIFTPILTTGGSSKPDG